VIFFADENISSQAAKLLEVFERKHEVRPHKAYFLPGISDTEWISQVASWEPKPAILGGDGRILTRPAELEALKQARLTFVFLAKGWTNLAWETFAWKLLKVWPDVVQNVERVRLPSLFQVTINEKVEHQGTLASRR